MVGVLGLSNQDQYFVIDKQHRKFIMVSRADVGADIIGCVTVQYNHSGADYRWTGKAEYKGRVGICVL